MLGSNAAATIGTSLSVQWNAFADRVQESWTFTSRPAGDRVPFTVWQRNVQPASDGAGGVIMRGKGGVTAFHLLAATATGSQGHSSTAHLVLNRVRPEFH